MGFAALNLNRLVVPGAHMDRRPGVFAALRPGKELDVEALSALTVAAYDDIHRRLGV